jgi:hypothetical protein
MKTHPSIFFLSTTRLMAAVALLLGVALSAHAATVLSLKGTSGEARQPADAEVRLSLLSYNDEASASAFVAKYQEYQASQDHQGFSKFIKEQPTRGYVFSKEATGYTIKYAWQDPAASDQHMVFVVTPALKTLNPYLWKRRNDSIAPFSVLDVKFDGDNAVVKSSLDSEVAVSADGKSLLLQSPEATEPFAVLQDNTPYYLKPEG